MIKTKGFYVNYLGEAKEGQRTEWKIYGNFEFENEMKLGYFKNVLINTFLISQKPPMAIETFEERAEFLAGPPNETVD